MTLKIRKQPYHLSFHLPVTQNHVQNYMKIKVSGWVPNYPCLANFLQRNKEASIHGEKPVSF